MHKRLFILFFIMLFTSRMVMAGGFVTSSLSGDHPHKSSYVLKASLSNMECDELPCIDEDFGKKARQHLPVLHEPSANFFITALPAAESLIACDVLHVEAHPTCLIVLYRRILI